MSVMFNYTARTRGGERVAGRMRASDRAAALATLRERRLVASELVASAALPPFAVWRRAKIGERLAFFRAYAALEEAGVDFSTSLELLTAQASSARFREALRGVRAAVERGGEKLHAAMGRRPDEFSDLEIAMVAAGEESGNRADAFDRLAGFLERDHTLRKRLAGALFYPALVVIVALIVSAYLLIVVVPQFAELFRQFGTAPSVAMAALLTLAHLAANPAAVAALLAISAAGGLGLMRWLANPSGALAFDRLRLRVPILGEALRKSVVARTARVMATLLQSGISQVRALDVSAPVAGSPLYTTALRAARDAIASGTCASLEEALSASGLFEPLALGFVRVGSHAGNIPQMLVKIAEYYEEDVEALLAALPAIVQTIVTVGLGFVIGTILYVVYVPLSTLAGSIR
jgi:type IV pilus assembly protein PilC